MLYNCMILILILYLGGSGGVSNPENVCGGALHCFLNFISSLHFTRRVLYCFILNILYCIVFFWYLLIFYVLIWYIYGTFLYNFNIFSTYFEYTIYYFSQDPHACSNACSLALLSHLFTKAWVVGLAPGVSARCEDSRAGKL